MSRGHSERPARNDNCMTSSAYNDNAFNDHSCPHTLCCIAITLACGPCENRPETTVWRPFWERCLGTWFRQRFAIQIVYSCTGVFYIPIAIHCHLLADPMRICQKPRCRCHSECGVWERSYNKFPSFKSVSSIRFFSCMRTSFSSHWFTSRRRDNRPETTAYRPFREGRLNSIKCHLK